MDFPEHVALAIERFGGKKGDLSRAVGEAVTAWIGKK